ncbi:macrophage mannose receptor 1-like [Xiphophorus maculatus]|uniref:macrophage mannose receptor 1-like n=1 Tax=Xiphophorus maculatus TaxID=8083 RepID=UPI000C6E6EB1|nr:macrophage mannose receptor 1-like [Xiphophorus maculatus]
MQWTLILLFLMAQCCFMDCQLYEFHYIKENKTWTEAQQYCREKHTDLATVTNMKDMERLINISAGSKDQAWIGLYYPTHGTRTWHWSLPGVEFDEREANWNPGEPTDKHGNEISENCGFLFNNFKWADGSCHHTELFLCYDDTGRNQKYHLIQDKKSWQKAQIYCRVNHTDLISGTKQLLDARAANVLNSVGKETHVYFGLFRDAWRWSDGSSLSFRHWHKGFSNQKPNSGQCAVFKFNDKGRWRNESCTAKKHFVCYDDKVILIKENKTWEDALTYCRDHHHDLVTITNMDDQIWIQEKVKNASTDYVWTGLRYTCTLDLWFWVSDEVVIYKNWAKGESMDDCDMSGAMETRGRHQWRKKNDSETFNFVCSKD